MLGASAVKKSAEATHRRDADNAEDARRIETLNHDSFQMKVLLLNQCFYPDVAATGQYLTDLAQWLTERGHSVTVLTSDRGYDDPSVRFARRETWRGINIIRIPSLSPGKKARWRRAVNFASFLMVLSARLLLLPRFDAVVALTSPPLISFLGALFVQLKGGKLFFWVMDLNPDEAFVAGWLDESTLVARLLTFCLQHSLRVAESIIVLDRFMKQRIVDKTVPDDKLAVVRPWPLSTAVHYDQQARQAFRERYELSEKFVVMYAGNHSPCHPLDTLLAAALSLSDHEDIVFCFVGGGSEQIKVREFAERQDLKNVLCLPYQTLAELSGSLSAADLHAVVMGERFAGIVHPCKIYNILAVGAPFLYIGPEQSHITDIAQEIGGSTTAYLAEHGDVEAVRKHVLEAASHRATFSGERTIALPEDFSRQSLLPNMMNVLESSATSKSLGNPAVLPSI